MIEALNGFDSRTAAGILARAAVSIDDELNPVLGSSLPNESAVRHAILSEVRRARGLAEDDNSEDALEIVKNTLDEELDRLDSAVDTDQKEVLQALGTRGELPTDLYSVTIIDSLRDLLGCHFISEAALIRRTVHEADQEQHEKSVDGGGHLISLFAKHFHSEYPYRSFLMLVASGRFGSRLEVHQAWRIYEDQVYLSGSSDLIECLRRFSEVFGCDIKVQGVVSKFFRLIDLPADGSFSFQVLPILGTDAKGRRTERMPNFYISAFTERKPDGTSARALVAAIDQEKYKKSLIAHGAWA